MHFKATHCKRPRNTNRYQIPDINPPWCKRNKNLDRHPLHGDNRRIHPSTGCCPQGDSDTRKIVSSDLGVSHNYLIIIRNDPVGVPLESSSVTAKLSCFHDHYGA
ncbi:hypothetical protein CEXT_414361 [Caerostris extrusa]|uniref:Uncharacterized protein n=1 Tax=Caerostris extrusa TaxID=172846 RepID=A0AAV4NSM4_CAEEX|nr:hypothetical protein CEXT_414361 [Caerostris extrusa]